MTMILDSTIRSLQDYLRLKEQRQAAEQQEPSSKKKHTYLVPERPKACPRCSAKECFWVKGYYFRWAVEGDIEQVLPIPRYICNCCQLVVSLLFAFLVPYRQFTKKIVAEAVQGYLVDRTTYRRAAGEIAGDNEDMQRPNHGQVWHWVELLATRSQKSLNTILQRACVTAGKESCLSGVHERFCPNATTAHSLEKASKLNCGTRLLILAEIWLQCQEKVIERLLTHFVDFVQPALSILTGRGVTLFTPQSSQQVIW